MTQPGISPAGGAEATFEVWLAKLRALAEAQNAGWLFSGNVSDLRDYFEAGKAPDEVLEGYDGMTEWRGCGCGGGG